MSALYRKYRPDSFDGVVGQEPIVTTLKNQIKHGRIGHAYLFTGSRGTGKTSCAKIFAKSVNCLTPKDGSACGVCAVCAALKQGENIDVIELDAASNNGVGEIRGITDNAVYTPIYGKYKVYIVDEVHMLSGPAFNALLKTLEEPPAHVIFILATTEAHKLPATILSRCMRFDFRLIPQADIETAVAAVYQNEGAAFEPEAVRLIAAAGEGSMRDALSIADRCLDFSETVTYDAVSRVLGTAGRERTQALLFALHKGDVGKALTVAAALAESGRSIQLVSNELIAFARDLLLLKTAGDGLLTDTKEHIEKLRLLAESYSVDFLCAVIGLFSGIEQELRYAQNPRLVLEAACVRAAKLLTADLAALEERVSRLEKYGVTVRAEVPGDMPADGRAAGMAGTGNAPAGAAAENPARPTDVVSVWGRLTTRFRRNNRLSLHYLAGRQNKLSIEGKTLTVRASDEDFLQLSDENTRREIEQALALDGGGLVLRIERLDGGGLDMDKELGRIQKLAGEDKVKIIQ
ncbi:MAG: DNA polymerase III subunit gamma/tau [Clostridiales bacterium]|nr:DNA polymerase III subunit gamma/tau [Clostridiales bacterium]